MLFPDHIVNNAFGILFESLQKAEGVERAHLPELADAATRTLASRVTAAVSAAGFRAGSGSTKALAEAIALTPDRQPRCERPRRSHPPARGDALSHALSFLQRLKKDSKGDVNKYGQETASAAGTAVKQIEDYLWWGNLFGTAFRGLSLAAVLLVARSVWQSRLVSWAYQHAHGEMIMVGAYTAFVVQNVFKSWFGASGAGFDCYFIAALVVSFLAAGVVGLALERGVIRFLYQRPLESLLATWGVSLGLQQVFRHTFGAANVQVSSPSWLSGSFVVSDVLFAYNRIFVIGFALFIILGTWFLLARTSFGLQIRAVMQHRAMASCLGVRTDRVNMMTFVFGSGLAGMAGACLSQIGNVGPSLGQNYIVDCFMIVVLGGVGNLAGTVSAIARCGCHDQILQRGSAPCSAKSPCWRPSSFSSNGGQPASSSPGHAVWRDDASFSR